MLSWLIDLIIPRKEFGNFQKYHSFEANLFSRNLKNTKVYYIFKYKGEIKNLFARIKKLKEFNILKDMSDDLLKFFPEDLKKYDYITFIPSDPARFLQRGFNTTEIVAQHLSKNLQIPVKKIFIQEKTSTPQSSLKKADRLKNVKGRFSLKNDLDLKNDSKIILIDDVVTTGSTISVCVDLLKKEYPKSHIAGLTIASTD